MDKTETYIKMCDCEEIQGQKVYHPESLYCTNQDIGEITQGWFLQSVRAKNIIWLPRQDQLQEMVSPRKDRLTGLLRDFHLFIDNEWERLPEGENHLNAIETHYLSMEQLWLAFVMKEKFNKVWNGEEWI